MALREVIGQDRAITILLRTIETISAGAEGTRPPQEGDPAFEGFDQFQTFFADVTAQPAPNCWGGCR